MRAKTPTNKLGVLHMLPFLLLALAHVPKAASAGRDSHAGQEDNRASQTGQANPEVAEISSKGKQYKHGYNSHHGGEQYHNQEPHGAQRYYNNKPHGWEQYHNYQPHGGDGYYNHRYEPYGGERYGHYEPYEGDKPYYNKPYDTNQYHGGYDKGYEYDGWYQPSYYGKQETDKCQGVTCLPSGPCKQRGPCNPSTGQCPAETNVDNGIACNGGDGACIMGACMATETINFDNLPLGPFASGSVYSGLIWQGVMFVADASIDGRLCRPGAQPLTNGQVNGIVSPPNVISWDAETSSPAGAICGGAIGKAFAPQRVDITAKWRNDLVVTFIGHDATGAEVTRLVVDNVDYTGPKDVDLRSLGVVYGLSFSASNGVPACRDFGPNDGLQYNWDNLVLINNIGPQVTVTCPTIPQQRQAPTGNARSRSGAGGSSSAVVMMGN